jgi:hypothetical protein
MSHHSAVHLQAEARGQEFLTKNQLMDDAEQSGLSDKPIRGGTSQNNHLTVDAIFSALWAWPLLTVWAHVVPSPMLHV